jgi:TIR domain
VKIFVSYSRTDAGELAEQTQRRFNGSEEYEVFTDVKSIKVGEVWSNTIENNISNCDVFVVIVTYGALQSPHVENEVLQAQRERKRIIPCFHRSVIHSEIKWGLNNIQGVEFEDKYELARNLYSKIAYGMQGRGSMRNNQRVEPIISKGSTTISRLPGVTIFAILNIIGGLIIFPIVFEVLRDRVIQSLGLVMFPIAIFSFVVGYGLLKGALKGMRWAWTATLVLSIISIALNVLLLSILTYKVRFVIEYLLLRFDFTIYLQIVSIVISGIILNYLYRPHVKSHFGKIVSTSGTASATQA